MFLEGGGAGVAPPLVLSRDRQSTRAVVELKTRSTGQASLEFSSVPPAVYASLRALVRSGTLDVGDVSSLPPWAEARRGAGLLRREFPGEGVTPVVVVLRYDEGSPLLPARVGQAYDLSRWLAGQPGVTGVRSVLDLAPDMSREDYQRMVKMPIALWPEEMQAAVARVVGERIMILAVSTELPAGSDEAHALVHIIRVSHPPVDGELLVRGVTAFDLDFMKVVADNAPLAIALVVVATYLALLVLLRSVRLPLKAVIVNLLSISASYGVLVRIFQEGHLAQWLDFTPGPIALADSVIIKVVWASGSASPSSWTPPWCVPCWCRRRCD